VTCFEVQPSTRVTLRCKYAAIGHLCRQVLASCPLHTNIRQTATRHLASATANNPANQAEAVAANTLLLQLRKNRAGAARRTFPDSYQLTCTRLIQRRKRNV